MLSLPHISSFWDSTHPHSIALYLVHVLPLKYCSSNVGIFFPVPAFSHALRWRGPYIVGNICQEDLCAGPLPLTLLTSLQGKKQSRVNEPVQGQEICVHSWALCLSIMCTYHFKSTPYSGSPVLSVSYSILQTQDCNQGSATTNTATYYFYASFWRRSTCWLINICSSSASM